MSVADLLRLGHTAMSSQQLADMALAEDRAARDAAKRGDREAHEAHDRESAALCRLLNDPVIGPDGRP